MCRNIKKLRYADRSPTETELYAAALQFVRKVSGYRQPSVANKEVFERATREVAASTERLLNELVTR